MAEPWSTFHLPCVGRSTAPQLHCCFCLERRITAQKRGSLEKAHRPSELLTTCAPKGAVPHPCCSLWSVPTPRSPTSFKGLQLHHFFQGCIYRVFYPCLNPQACARKNYGFSGLFIQFSNVYYFLYADTCYILSQLQYPKEIPAMNSCS